MSPDEVHPWHVFAQRILHSAACSTSGVSHALHQAARGCQRPQAPFAAITSGDEKKRTTKKPVTEAALADGSQAAIPEQILTPEEIAIAREEAKIKKLKKKRVIVDGKETNMYELEKQREHERKIMEVAGDEPQIRDMSHQELIDRIPGQDLRPGAFKMQLRAREEAELPLDLLARGTTYSPRPVFGNLLGGRRDLSFGIYGRADEARRLLDEKWSGLPVEYVIEHPDFFNDVLDNAAQLELTVMALPVRPVPLAPLRENLYQRLASQLGSSNKTAVREEGSSGDFEESSDNRGKAALSKPLKQLQDLASTFSDEHLRGLKVVDEQGNLVPDTHFIFSAMPDSGLLAEVITPGNLRDRMTYTPPRWRSKKLMRAVFGMFLGDNPLDVEARTQAGQRLVYLTNGFKLHPDPSNPNQFFEGEGGKPYYPKLTLTKLEPTPKLFSLEGRGKTAQLVNNVEERRRFLLAN